MMRLEDESISLTLCPVVSCQLCCFVPLQNKKNFQKKYKACFWEIHLKLKIWWSWSVEDENISLILRPVVGCQLCCFVLLQNKKTFQKKYKSLFFFRNPLEIKNLMRLEVENISLTLRPVVGCQLCCFAPCVSTPRLSDKLQVFASLEKP